MQSLPRSPPDGGARTHTCFRRAYKYILIRTTNKKRNGSCMKEGRRQLAPPLVTSVSIEANGYRDRSCCSCDPADHHVPRWDGAPSRSFPSVSTLQDFRHACRPGSVHLRWKNDPRCRGEVRYGVHSGEVRQCFQYRPDGRNAAARSLPCHPRCCTSP